MDRIIKTYVRKIYSGSYNEIITEEVDSRDPTKIENDGIIIGFSFYDIEFIVDGRNIVFQREFNRSKLIYFGERLSLTDLKTRCINDPKYGSIDFIIKKMESNGNEYACYTNGGCLLIMNKGEKTYDEIITKKNEKTIKRH